jgi:hypothetical protein
VQSLPEDVAVASQLCQVKEQLRVGFYAGPNLVAIDPCNTDANQSVALEKKPPRSFVMYNYSAAVSPDGNWVAKTAGHELELSSQLTERSRVAVRAGKFLTPPRWSPDSRFVFIVTSENRDKKRPFFKCVDDVSEIYAVNAHSGNGTIIGTVCAGIPVDAFRWLQ